MAQATPEPSKARQYAVKNGYIVSVVLATFLLVVVLLTPSLQSLNWVYLVPPTLGVLAAVLSWIGVKSWSSSTAE